MQTLFCYRRVLQQQVAGCAANSLRCTMFRSSLFEKRDSKHKQILLLIRNKLKRREAKRYLINSLPLLKFSAEAHSPWELKFPSSQTVLWLRTVPLSKEGELYYMQTFTARLSSYLLDNTLISRPAGHQQCRCYLRPFAVRVVELLVKQLRKKMGPRPHFLVFCTLTKPTDRNPCGTSYAGATHDQLL